jgi:hypothetical protein
MFGKNNHVESNMGNRKEIYTLYDTATKSYMNPIIAMAAGAVIRDLTEFAKDKSTTVGKHPEHYQLYKIGDWFEQKGIIESHAPEHICNVWELLDEQYEDEHEAINKPDITHLEGIN